MTGRRLEAGDIARMLGERIEQLCAQLLPGGHRNGRMWRVGSLAGEPGQSLAVTLTGPKRGCWFEFNGQFGGDALSLVAKTLCRDDIGEALAWSHRWLGLGGLDAAELQRERERAAAVAARRRAAEQRERAAKARGARALWQAAAPLAPGDIVWRYLTGRGIQLELLPHLPGALRCHAALWHRIARRAFPAMVAAITASDGTHLATQRTWLELQSNGGVKKAPLGANAKMSIGPFRYAGGAINLACGASGKPWCQAIPGEVVAFAEGIEDGLTFACARPDLRVAACATSLAYLAHVALPPDCGGVLVVAQNDPIGSEAMKAQRRGIEGLRKRGLAVSVLRPPIFVKDLNDWAQWLRSRSAFDAPVCLRG